MLKLITEITLLGILAWTIAELSYVPSEFMQEWKTIKKAQGLQSQRQKSK